MSRAQLGKATGSVFAFLSGLLLLALAALAVGGFFAWREASRPGPLEKDAIVLLEPGTTVAGIAAKLSEAGAVRYPQLFIAAVRVSGRGAELKAGEYRIPAEASVFDIIDLVVKGKSILHYFTAPEGKTTAQILQMLRDNETLAGELTLTPGEGELLPETYAFSRGRTRDQLVGDMMDAQDVLIEELWNGRAHELPFSTPGEAIILASIVEKETGIAEERPRIAAVFVNRLKKGMRLESDPTIIYGITGGEPLGRGLRLSELRATTPYNTYIISGLPPTPIANPGRASIEAVLNPADTDDLFFVADGTGGHLFASTLDEHSRNVAKWRQVERARGEDG